MSSDGPQTAATVACLHCSKHHQETAAHLPLLLLQKEDLLLPAVLHWQQQQQQECRMVRSACPADSAHSC
jgi:hypothetical protein